MKPGDTFVIDIDGGTNRHMWIVLAVYVPDLDTSAHAVIVSVTSMPSRFSDPTCILTPADVDAHPFVAHESFAFYGRMREKPVSDLAAYAAGNGHAPVSAVLLARLRDGVHRSSRTPRGMKSKVPNE